MDIVSHIVFLVAPWYYYSQTAAVMCLHTQAWDPVKLFMSTNIGISPAPKFQRPSDSFDHDFNQSQNQERNSFKEEWLFSWERTQKCSHKSLWVTTSNNLFLSLCLNDLLNRSKYHNDLGNIYLLV